MGAVTSFGPPQARECLMAERPGTAAVNNPGMPGPRGKKRWGRWGFEVTAFNTLYKPQTFDSPADMVDWPPCRGGLVLPWCGGRVPHRRETRVTGAVAGKLADSFIHGHPASSTRRHPTALFVLGGAPALVKNCQYKMSKCEKVARWQRVENLVSRPKQNKTNEMKRK